MKRLVLVLVIGVFAMTMSVAAEEASQELVEFVDSVLSSYSEDDTILQAVVEENSKGKTLAQIQEVDGRWKATPGIADFMEPILNCDLAEYLRELQDTHDFLAEIFVMDDLGANVAMTDKTSDYWQGDEGKFKNSFADGDGAIFIDEVEFDESTQVYMVQVSIPVLDGETAVGAITFGVDLDRFEETM
jgi:hypothetical protein